jgi:predicted RNA-binding Zn ribbon-like protein
MTLSDVFKTTEAQRALDAFCAEQTASAQATLATADPLAAPGEVYAAQAMIRVLTTLREHIKQSHEVQRHDAIRTQRRAS